MSEFLGVVLGVAIGGGLSRLRSWRTRVALVVPAVPLAGVGTSAVNGELGSGLWALFVSFDTLLAGLGIAVGFAAVRLRPGLASPATSAGGPRN